MKGFIKFKASNEQLEKLREFVEIREDFEENWKEHVSSTVTPKWFIFSDISCRFDTPPKGLYWWGWDGFESSETVFKCGWYEDFLNIYRMIKTGEEVLLDQDTYKYLEKVLEGELL